MDAGKLGAASEQKAGNAGVGVLLYAALLLCFLAVWKGEPHGGYEDMRDYFYMSEGLWLRGDMSFVDARAPGPQYHRYPVGLAVVSGPFVILGHALQSATNGAVGQRAVIALVIPFLTAGAGLLLFLIGRALGCSARASVWAVLLFALASPILTFVRIYYADTAVVFFVLLAAWSGLLALQAAALPAPNPTIWKWAVLAGLGLAGAATCHYASIPLAFGLWVALVCGTVRRQCHTKPLSADSGTKPLPAPRSPLPELAALSAIPALAALGLMALNQFRHGHPLRTGYEAFYSSHFSFPDAHAAGGNSVCLLLLAWRTPWVLLALFGVMRAAWGVSGTTHHEPRATNQVFARAGLLALACEALFLLFFNGLCRFPLRFALPMLGLLAVGLPLAADELLRRGAGRVLFYAGAFSLCWNAAFFIRGEDMWPSFFVDERYGPELLCHVWYMKPLLPDDARHWGSPVGWPQMTILCALLAGGILLLCLASRRARMKDGG